MIIKRRRDEVIIINIPFAAEELVEAHPVEAVYRLFPPVIPLLFP
jgi:hypothetical protein